MPKKSAPKAVAKPVPVKATKTRRSRPQNRAKSHTGPKARRVPVRYYINELLVEACRLSQRS